MASSTLKNVLPHLECDICQQRYDQPKVLHCQHSFCEMCLEEYYRSRYGGQPEIPCPLCRRTTVLPPERIRGLQTNYQLMGIVQAVTLQEEVPRSEHAGVACGLCDTGNAALQRCPDCRPKHSRCAGASSHTAAASEDSRRKSAVPETTEEPWKCQKHTGLGMRFDCETCGALTRSRSLTVHGTPEHRCVAGGEAALKYKQSLQAASAHLTEDVKRLAKTGATLSQEKQRLTQNVAKAVKAVADRAQEMRDEIRAQEKKTISKIQQIQHDRNATYDKHQKTTALMLRGKQDSLRTTLGLLHAASDSHLLSQYPVIGKDLEARKNQTPEQLDAKLSYLSFSPGSGHVRLGSLAVTYKWEMLCESRNVSSAPGEKGIHTYMGIAAINSGRIAVADYSDNRVVICRTGGQQCTETDIPLKRPVAVASTHNPAPYLLVLLDGSRYVRVFDAEDSHSLVMRFPTVPTGAHWFEGKKQVNLQSLAVRGNGTVLVGDVKRMVWTEHGSTNGEILRTTPALRTPPYYLAVDLGTDRVVISGLDARRVDVADSTGTTLFTVHPTICRRPADCHGVCCHGSSIYLVMYTCAEQSGGFTGHIHRYDLYGRFCYCVSQGLNCPHGIAADADGRLHVADGNSVKTYHSVGC